MSIEENDYYWSVLAGLADWGVPDEEITETLERMELVKPVTKVGGNRIHACMLKSDRTLIRPFMIYVPNDVPEHIKPQISEGGKAVYILHYDDSVALTPGSVLTLSFSGPVLEAVDPDTFLDLYAPIIPAKGTDPFIMNMVIE